MHHDPLILWLLLLVHHYRLLLLNLLYWFLPLLMHYDRLLVLSRLLHLGGAQLGLVDAFVKGQGAIVDKAVATHLAPHRLLAVGHVGLEVGPQVGRIGELPSAELAGYVLNAASIGVQFPVAFPLYD